MLFVEIVFSLFAFSDGGATMIGLTELELITDLVAKSGSMML